jgi:demethylsterigmatocystin 6-O-methyltransferase
MHDHADDKCLEILANVVDAMTDESTLLLDEIVVPNPNVGWYVTQTDLGTMVQFSSTERTEEQFIELLAKAGLKVQKVTTYTHAFQLSIIAATKVKQGGRFEGRLLSALPANTTCLAPFCLWYQYHALS